MIVVKKISYLPYIEKAVLAIGKFDGFHIGHQLILSYLFKSDNPSEKKILFTFNKHPLNVISSNRSRKKILLNRERISFVQERYVIDYFLMLPFTKKFSMLTHKRFIECLFKKIRKITLIVGENFCFGKDGKGNVEYLKTLNKVKVINVPLVKVEKGDFLSSTYIRRLIEEGFIQNVNKFLGYPYFITGEIIKGDSIGRKIGYPTMNIKIHPSKAVPKNGVYHTMTKVDGMLYNSMSFLGNKKLGKKMSYTLLETYILNYDCLNSSKEKFIKVFFCKRIRDTYFFSNVQDLKNQLKKDEEKVLNEKNC